MKKLSEEAFQEFKRLLAGLPTEDGRHYVDDMVIWADEHGPTLIEELTFYRNQDNQQATKKEE